MDGSREENIVPEKMGLVQESGITSVPASALDDAAVFLNGVLGIPQLTRRASSSLSVRSRDVSCWEVVGT